MYVYKTYFIIFLLNILTQRGLLFLCQQ